MNDIYKYLWVVPSFILLQVLVLNNIQFVNYINPLVYILLLITLPQDTEKWFFIIFSFILGILLDVFEGNIGLNASSLVFISFLLPYLHKVLIPKNSVDEKDRLSLKILGVRVFSVYAISVIFIHNLFLFFLEHFSTSGFLFIILKVVLSSIVTFIIIFTFQLFTLKSKE